MRRPRYPAAFVPPEPGASGGKSSPGLKHRVLDSYNERKRPQGVIVAVSWHILRDIREPPVELNGRGHGKTATEPDVSPCCEMKAIIHLDGVAAVQCGSAERDISRTESSVIEAGEKKADKPAGANNELD